MTLARRDRTPPERVGAGSGELPPARLDRLVRRIEDLPTLPRTVVRIGELVDNPHASARDLAGVVTEDQVLTARLLKLVNSSFYGFPRRISTVTDAVVLVGFDAIRNLLLTTSIFDLFSARDRRHARVLEAMWDHALGCGVGAKVIGAHLQADNLEELFVCGLLHDIGKLIEIVHLPDAFARIVALARRDGLLLHDAEARVLGTTHTAIGQRLARHWNLSERLCRVIAHHHVPREAGRYSREAAIVHLADLLCRALDLGSGGDDRVPELDRPAWDSLDLAIDRLDDIVADMVDAFDDLRQFLHLAADKKPNASLRAGR